MPRSRLVRTAVSSVLLAVVYFIAARVGLMLATVGHSVSLVWPPTGLALGVLLMHGRSLWPGLALGAFVVNATTEGVPVLAAAGIALGNTSEALVGTWLLERSGFDPSLRRVTDVLRLMVVAAVASPPVSAALGTLSLWLGGVLPTGQVPLALRAWWVGDAMGALVIAPLLWSAHGLTAGGRPRLARVLEATILGGLLVWLSFLIFQRPAEMGTMIPGAFLRPYVLFPLSLWAALRFEARGAAWASFTVAVVALVATVARIGPFHLASRGDSLLTLQLYLAIFVATSLVLAAAAAERVDAVHAREDFISIASHELRTPLTPLSLQVERLGRRVGQGKALPEDLEPIQQSLARQVDRMTALVDVLLDVTRLRTGPMVLQRESLDLATLARETVDSLSDDLRRARCALSFEAPHPVVAEWDPTRMQQALINLLTNATKYAAGAPVAVSVSAEPSRARLVVRDGGPGIALGEQAVLFHRFARLPSAHRQGGGLGLGLYITRQIVEAHGGTIRLDSRPGQGATFTCTFPLDPQPAEGESLPGSPEKHG